MPIYEYKCEKCNSTFEAMQAISAKPLKNCNSLSCKGKVRRLVSASGFILKGSGWYTSDYPSEARKKGWESEGKNAATATSSKNTENNESNETTTSAPPKKAVSAEKTAAQPAPKKTTQKNPYTGGKKSRSKTST